MSERTSPGASNAAALAFDAEIERLSIAHAVDREKLDRRVRALARETTLSLWEAFDYVSGRLGHPWSADGERLRIEVQP